MTDEVLYEETGGIAIVAINRPERLRTTQLLGTLFDGITRHTEEAYRWAESFQGKGSREAIRQRDAPWQDYGERPKD